MTSIDFDGQVAVVTGAGGGLGRTYALELGRRGASVVVNDLGGSPDGRGSSGDAAQATVDDIVAAGGQAVANNDSVASEAGGEAIIAAAVDAFGRVDIVINNAGILRDKSFARLTPEDRDALFDVHLRGAFNVSQPAFRLMKDQGFGRFLFTSSGSGLFGNFGQTNYAAAKMGVVGLSSALAIEGAKSGITSNVIAPIARTRLTEDLLGPLGAQLDPELITPLAVYLVSRQCELTHDIFTAGAGWFARVFIGVASGWSADSGELPTVEDIARNIGDIRAEEGYIVPVSADGVLAPIMKQLA